MGVYFIKDERQRVKIGFASNPRARLSALQSSNADRLEIIRWIDGVSCITERWFHRYFRTYRIRGDWFGYHSEMLTMEPPIEPPLPPQLPKPRDPNAVRDYIREADRLGILSPAMKESWAPFLVEQERGL